MSESNDTANNNQDPAPQPGAVISPGPAPQPAATPPQQPIAPPAQPEAQPPFTQDNQQVPDPAAPAAQSSDGGVSWVAPEFIEHDKSTNWYLTLAGAAVGLSVIFYLITRDKFTVGVVIAAALILGVYGSRKPRLLNYKVDTKGLTIGDKFRAYKDFKSYSILPEGLLNGIDLMPLKRFAPPITIYFTPQDEEAILAVLSNQLPFEEPRRDAVDSLMRRIRF